MNETDSSNIKIITYSAQNSPLMKSINSEINLSQNIVVFVQEEAVFALPLVDDIQHFAQTLKGIIGKPKYLIIQHGNEEVALSLGRFLQIFDDTIIVLTRNAAEKLFSQLTGKQFIIANNETKIEALQKFRFFKVPLEKWPDSLILLYNDSVLLSGEIFSNILGNYELFQANFLHQKPPPINFSVAIPLYGDLIPRERLEIGERVVPDEQPIRAIIVYQSLYGSTERASRYLLTCLQNENVNVQIFEAKHTNLLELVEAALSAQIVVLGSPTLNGDVLPEVAKCVSLLKQHKFMQGKLGLAIGAYGWSNGDAERHCELDFQQMGVQCCGSVTWKFNYGEAEKEKIEKLVNNVVQQLKK